MSQVSNRAGGGALKLLPAFDKTVQKILGDLTALLPDERGRVGFGGNAMLAQLLHSLNFKSARVVLGGVVSALPYANWYKVQLDQMAGSIPCYKGAPFGTMGPIGVREHSVIQPNSMVVVAIPDQGTQGIILSVIPSQATDPNSQISDWIFQGACTGLKREDAYRGPIKNCFRSGGVVDYSAGRPMDETPGEWGVISETGLSFHLDSYTAFIRANEICGLFLNYFDSFARFAAWNLSMESAGTKLQNTCDEGEIQTYYGNTPYFHEALGALEAGAAVFEEKDDKEVQFQKPVGKFEPINQDTKPFHRYREWGGYLGQGRKRSVVAPPVSSQTYLYSDAEGVPALGVFEENLALDGMYMVRSAKGILICKRGAIPSAERAKVPEDTTGDDRRADNYRFSGEGSGGEPHKVKDPKLPEETELPHLLGLATAEDAIAFAMNWKGLHPFHYHKEDFKVAEEEKAPGKVMPIGFIPISALTSGSYIPQPGKYKIKIDNRYEEVEYFENETYLALNNDGTIGIADGYGAEIRMVGGQIHILSPGDMVFHSGKSIRFFAGDDVTMSAKNSVDINAANKDLTLAAGQNFSALGGNSGAGGVLIENKSSASTNFQGVGEDTSAGGILLKSANSPIYTMAQSIYLRTGSDGIGQGPIVLDAAKGKDQIICNAQSITRFISGQLTDNFVDADGSGNVRASNFFGANLTSLSGSTIIGNQLVVTGRGGTLINGGMQVYGGIATLSGGPTGKIKDPGLILQNIERINEGTRNRNQAGERAFDQVFDQGYYAEGKIGSVNLQAQAGFSFRNEDQYGSQTFRLAEPRWAQLVRLGGEGSQLKKFDMKAVVKGGEETFPFPGKSHYQDSISYLRLSELKLFDPTTGYSKNRADGAYEDVTLGDFEKASMQDLPTIL